MQRDKRGRFVKKAWGGTQLSSPSLNKPIEPIKATKIEIGTYDPLGINNTTTPYSQFSSLNNPSKIQYYYKNGKMVGLDGKEIDMNHYLSNRDSYEVLLQTPHVETPTAEVRQDSSAGMHFTDKESSDTFKRNNSINKAKLADFLELTRSGIGASVNNKIAERALKAERPFLQDISESHRSVYGDYRSQIQGEKSAAQLRNLASKPLTSDGALQQQMMLDAQLKGNDYIEQGNAKDDAMRRQTQEIAWQQEKENQQQRQAAAMQNRQAMLMSDKNKAQIRNMRDSANYSQVVAPYLSGIEQRLRQKAVEQDYYQDYYNEALVNSDVWNNYSESLTPKQLELRNLKNSGGTAAVEAYIKEHPEYETDWNQLNTIMRQQAIIKTAALRGITIDPKVFGNTATNSTDSFNSGTNYFPINKKGGTIYKAKLTKRTKDNDRASRSIESSKKIAARFLEKAVDSLYTYDQVELIAKPKNKRKYQAGGGLPFVGFTPVFATSETGTPKVADTKKSKEADLTTKDILELLKDMDGLPVDESLIVSALQNFHMSKQDDPLGIMSSSDLASQYLNIIHKIKIAKFNKDEYNNAFNQLKGNGGLSELAVTSDGMLIGSNADGDFKYFTPDQVNSGMHLEKGYSLLTNSNLLYLRANSPDAAFSHALTTVAQNGIGMEVITKQVNDILQNLGKNKDSEEGFVQMGSSGQIKSGLQYLQKAMQEIGDSSLASNMSIADYYHSGYLTEDQAQQAQLALNYIWNALSTNAKSLLQVKGGSHVGAQALMQSLVFSKTSTETQFKASPKKMSKTSSSASSSGDDIDSLKLSPVQMMQLGYTDHTEVTLQKGTKYAVKTTAQVLPLYDVNKEGLGVTTLDRVASSTFGGALDMNNVTMGGQLVDPHAMHNVQIDATNLYVMNLPIDKNSPDGTIKPDLAWLQKIEAIDKTIRDQGITDIDTINALYVEAGLPVLMDDNGQLNTRDYCKFGVLNGHALNTAFKDLDALDDTMVEIEDEDQIENVMRVINGGKSEKDRIDFNSKGFWDFLPFAEHDSLFEGTVYIPIRTNPFTGMMGGGQYPTAEEAAEVEALVQQKERTRGYVDPGLLTE